MLEPHLKEVQGHVTRLEQQLAPFRGMTPQQVKGLATFARQFDANPLGMWLAMAADLQKRGTIHADLDIEDLHLAATGKPPAEGGADVVEEGDPWAGAPAWALELRERQDRYDQKDQANQRQAQERAEDAALNAQLKSMKTKLKEGGWDEKVLTDSFLIGHLLAHGGNAAAALQDLSGVRTGLLKGVVQPNDDSEVTMPRGAPPTRRTRSVSEAERKRDPIKAAGAAAEQFLRRAAQESQ
jgi:hypothetical protein